MRRRALAYRHAAASLDLPFGNIIHQYDFDGDSTDAVGNLDGTDTNMSYGAGVGDNLAAIFDGTGYVVIPGNISGSNPEFSYSLMTKLNADTSNQRIFAFSNTNDGFILIEYNAGGTSRIKTRVYQNPSSPALLDFEKTGITQTDWIHIIITIDKDLEASVYYNGILHSTQSITTNTLGVSPFRNVIGASRTYLLKSDGYMTALKSWDVILTSDEALDLATAELAGIKVN